MPLNLTQLTDAIEDILDGTVPVPTVLAAGNAWGDAYNAYALTGAANGIPPITAAGLPVMKTAMVAAFTVQPGVPATVAAAITAALDAYWLAAVFAGAIPPLPFGAGAAVLIASLTGTFVVAGGTHAAKASAIAGAMDVYTKLILVTFPAVPTPLVFPVV